MTKQSCRILTVSGLLVNPFDLKPEEILLEDIAHALSFKCRWMGHVPGFLSVAHHSICVSSALPKELRLQGLMHDAAEAYFGDIARPFLALPELAFLREAQDEATRRIFSVFHIPYPLDLMVVKADDIALETEKQIIYQNTSYAMEWVNPLHIRRTFLHLFERYYEYGKSEATVR